MVSRLQARETYTAVITQLELVSEFFFFSKFFFRTRHNDSWKVLKKTSKEISIFSLYYVNWPLQRQSKIRIICDNWLVTCGDVIKFKN